MAGLIDEIGIVDILNKKLGIDPREKVSTGVIAKAMLLNGLGFVSAPLDLLQKSLLDPLTPTISSIIH